MLHKLFLILILFFFTTGFSFSQTVSDTLVAHQYYKKADSLFQNKTHKKSIEYFKKALTLYMEVNNWKQIASCYNGISSNQLYLRIFEESLQNSEQSIEICDKYLKKLNKQKADAYSNIGEYYVKTLNYTKADIYHKKSLNIRLKILPKNHLDIVSSHHKIGFINYSISNYKKAQKYYKKALEIVLKTVDADHQEVGNSYMKLGNIYNILGELDKAIDHYKKYLIITRKNSGENHISMAYGYVNIGVAYEQLKRYKHSINFYQKAIPICIQKGNNLLLLGVYNNLGIALRSIGEYNKALEYFKKSLNIRLQIYKRDHPKIAIAYNAIGSILNYKLDHKNALKYYKKALKINNKLYGENHINVSYSYENIANSYQKNKQYDLSEEYFNKSILVKSNILEENNPLFSTSYSNLAEVYFQKEEYDKALFYYKKSLKIIENAYGKDHSLNTNSYINLAKINIAFFQYDKAIVCLDKALYLNMIDKKIKNVFTFSNYYNLLQLLESFKKKASVLQALYKISGKINFLNQSISIYENLDSLLNKIRNSYQNNKDKISFGKDVKNIYTDAIKAQFLKYKATQKLEDLENMFYFAEKSKANNLREILKNQTSKQFLGITEALLKLERNLKTDYAFYKSQIAKEQSNKSIDSIKLISHESKLFDINRKQDSLKLIFEKDHPKYYQLKYQNKVVSVSEIQQKLDDKKTILEFFTTDSITYAFTISKNSIAVKELVIPPLSEKLKELQLAITSENTINYRKVAHDLYKELILPITNNINGNELIIIPDESLWHLNFDLLLTKKENVSNSSKNLSYLLRDYATSYANSATLLFNSSKDYNRTKQIENECLAFSFSDTSEKMDVKTISMTTLRSIENDLPGTRKEIKDIANIIKGQYYYGNQATEANFKKNVGKYSVLHLALHGEVNEEKPENSMLYFTKSKDSTEDNLLYSHELYTLDIPAELTVLSACNTGTGKIAKGEGIMSLGNAFQYAGTKSLLLSKWAISDKTTPDLIKYFYTNLKAGMNKAKALQQAKLKYLDTTETFYTSPFYWGSFYLIGDTSPIYFKSSLNNLYLIIGLFTLLCISLTITYVIKYNGL